MPTPCRLACLFVFVAVLIPPSVAGGGIEGNEMRLRAMPRERRMALAEKLKQFDALSWDEKDAIRKLDQKIANLPPDERAFYRSVLRRYHLWIESLTDAQRNELSNTPAERRTALVTKFRNQASAVPDGRTITDLLQVIDFGAPSPFEMAHFHKLWLKLSPVRQAEVGKLPPGFERLDRLTALSHEYKIAPENRLPKAEVDALIKQLEEQFKAKGWVVPLMKKAAEKDARGKHADSTRESKERRRVAENYYFVLNPPQAVDAEHLMWFSASMPPWLLASFDYLPPEEARRRLTILYRLVDPHPSERPPSQTATSPKPAASAASKAAASAPPQPTSQPVPVHPF
jgi:Protein of unknown function (DUF3106)